MNFLRSRLTAFFAFFAGVLTAVALRGLPWNLDAGLCVGYTVEVVGLALTDKRARVFPRDPARPLSKILLVHLGFLVAVVVIARLSLMLLPPRLHPVPHHPRPINWGLLLAVAAVFALAYWEVRLLFRKSGSIAPRPNAGETGFEPLVSPPPNMPIVNGVPFESGTRTPAPVPSAPVAAIPVASALASVSELDENDAFMEYLRGKERAFRKPGVSVKQEYELWQANRAMIRGGGAPKKPRGLSRFF
jgi:hypothetical protein